MIEAYRQAYNRRFTGEAYQFFLDGLQQETGVTPAFRVAETPVFIPHALTQQLIEACESIIGLIMQPDFKSLTDAAIPKGKAVPHENGHSSFIIIDFAVTYDENGALAPQLIELQGFPSLFGFQELLARQYRKHLHIPDELSSFPPGMDAEQYLSLLQRTILAGGDAILLEVFPRQQKTLIDFVLTERMLGTPIVCASELEQEGHRLYYRRNGRKCRVRRIYNRMISEDMDRYALTNTIHFHRELNVSWAPHPNWYYRISKFLLPLIEGPFAPKAWFLDELPVLPQDLHNYVLKPLFSFAGQGVIIEPSPADIDAIKDPENWILQQKVQYAPAIVTPDGPAKCEIRMMYCWPDDVQKPILAHSLARISKGKMIGVNYNSGQTWVGGSSCFFEQ